MKYKVVCFVRVEEEEEEVYDTMLEAEEVLNHCQFLQPENIYKIVAVED